LLAADKYPPSNVAVADELPANWLGGRGDSGAQRAAGALKAVLNVAATLRASEHPMPQTQMLMLWIAEATDPSAAAALAEMARKRQPRDYPQLAFSNGKLVCLLVAMSMVGTSVESDSSLARFTDGLTKLL
jgi:hypothetical protein